MERDAMLNIRLPQDVKDAVRRAGDDDAGRSLSGMVVKILFEWCSANGYLSTGTAPKPAVERTAGPSIEDLQRELDACARRVKEAMQLKRSIRTVQKYMDARRRAAQALEQAMKEGK